MPAALFVQNWPGLHFGAQLIINTVFGVSTAQEDTCPATSMWKDADHENVECRRVFNLKLHQFMTRNR